MNADDYHAQLVELQPPGTALPRDAGSIWQRILGAAAEEPARVDARVQDLLREFDPREALELLPDFERAFGLPDACSRPAETLQERRAAVHEKMTGQGRQDRAYYMALAIKLGYAITITEYRPFICGLSRCGDVLNGEHRVRFYWRVTVHGPRTTYFRCGVSTPPERLGTIARADDLECRFRENMQEHTVLIFEYQ